MRVTVLSMFSSLYIVFRSVQAAVNTKAVRVSCFEFFLVRPEYALKVKSDSVCPDCKIPRYVAEFFRYMLKIKVMSLKTELFDYVCDFSTFSTLAECGVKL